jgi:hypothetical protein
MTHASPHAWKRRTLLAAALLIVPSMAAVSTNDVASASQIPFNATASRSAADYTANSWTSYATSGIADGLVMIRGLTTLVADYRTRVPASYTPGSWGPFATALTTAAHVATDAAATQPQVAAAKTALVSAAAGLVAADEGTFQTITNDTFWKDTSGNPIYSQGGGIFKFGDTYYWYGVHYLGAEHYRASPTKKFDGEVTFVSIPVYSSKDLVNWTFENNVATTATTLPGGTRLGGWVGRLGVFYNEASGKYVLVAQGPGGVIFLRGDSPTDTFEGAAVQGQITNSPTAATGDQTIFTDDNGEDYLVFSNASGRAHAFVSKLRDSDGLYAEPAVQIGYNTSGREGNAMFKLDGRYYMAASDLHGWNSSVAHTIESTTSNIQGAYSAEYTMAGTEMDYGHVTQTGFFVTVNGTKQHTVIFAGDRWSDFAWNGIGYNQWMPVDKTGSKPEFHSLSQWQFNATTGEWRAGPQNNYVLNPDVQADRVLTTAVTGWTNFTESGSGAIVTNVKGGANGSQYALQIGAAQAYSGGVRQKITVPAGTYTLSTFAKTSGALTSAQVTVTDASGAVHTLTIPAGTAWTRRALAGFALAAGTATVTVRAASSNGYLTVDQLSLVKTSTD